jgi:uncharacterized protein YndB with AHSA1/START domain
MKMSKPEFVYTTYIRTTPEKVWSAITNPEFNRQYWKYELKSDWKQGSKWTSVSPEGTAGKIHGEILEANPPERLVLSWQTPDNPADKSRVTFDIEAIIEAVEDMTRLTITHDQLSDDMSARISAGWPRVLSSMKTFLETGSPLDTLAGKTACTAEKKAVTA